MKFFFLLLIPCIAAAKPLNILFLCADDWRHDTLGCAGNPVVKTPCLDALAKEGTRFTHACVTTSICGVSRASLLTGQWMSRHGNRGFNAFTTPWDQTWPGILRGAGYWSGHVGKWHCGKFEPSRFDFARLTGGNHFQDDGHGGRIHVTDRNERDTLAFLRDRPKDKPFCLAVNFPAPHAEDSHPDQYLSQPEFASLYEDTTIPTPAGADGFALLPPAVGNEANEGRRRWHLRFDTPEKYQRSMKNYYRLVSGVDAACGKILAELTAQGLADQTLVVFTADNGYFLGERGLADKWYPYEESLRVPLIIRDPRLPANRRGKIHDEFVLNVDLAPTLLAASGQAVPGTMQGRDFSPLYLDEPAPSWRTDFYYEHAVIRNADFIPASEALVTHDWKYILWPDSGFEELFDLRNDPRETKNLASTQTTTLATVRERFETLKREAR